MADQAEGPKPNETEVVTEQGRLKKPINFSEANQNVLDAFGNEPGKKLSTGDVANVIGSTVGVAKLNIPGRGREQDQARKLSLGLGQRVGGATAVIDVGSENTSPVKGSTITELTAQKK